jgi:fumarate hydratase, class II
MNIAAVKLFEERLISELDRLATVIETKSRKWMDVVKIGRTHP